MMANGNPDPIIVQKRRQKCLRFSSCNRQRSRRIDMYEIIVLERSGTFQHYFVRGVLQ